MPFCELPFKGELELHFLLSASPELPFAQVGAVVATFVLSWLGLHFHCSATVGIWFGSWTCPQLWGKLLL